MKSVVISLRNSSRAIEVLLKIKFAAKDLHAQEGKNE